MVAPAKIKYLGNTHIIICEYLPTSTLDPHDQDSSAFRDKGKNRYLKAVARLDDLHIKLSYQRRSTVFSIFRPLSGLLKRRPESKTKISRRRDLEDLRWMLHFSLLCSSIRRSLSSI